jgi:hypothetical protein
VSVRIPERQKKREVVRSKREDMQDERREKKTGEE